MKIYKDKLIRIVLTLFVLILLLCYCGSKTDKKKDTISVISFDSVATKPTIIYKPEIEYPDLPRRVGIEGIALVQ